MSEDNCTRIPETFKLWDLVRLILKVLQYIYNLHYMCWWRCIVRCKVAWMHSDNQGVLSPLKSHIACMGIPMIKKKEVQYHCTFIMGVPGDARITVKITTGGSIQDRAILMIWSIEYKHITILFGSWPFHLLDLCILGTSISWVCYQIILHPFKLFTFFWLLLLQLVAQC